MTMRARSLAKLCCLVLKKRVRLPPSNELLYLFYSAFITWPTKLCFFSHHSVVFVFWIFVYHILNRTLTIEPWPSNVCVPILNVGWREGVHERETGFWQVFHIMVTAVSSMSMCIPNNAQKKIVSQTRMGHHLNNPSLSNSQPTSSSSASGSPVWRSFISFDSC